MTTITLEVPDELAARLDPLRDRLPELLSKLLESRQADRETEDSIAEITAPVYQEVIDFLASGPTPKQIIAFKISPAAQERLEELLDKNREEGLTQAECAELDVYELVHNAMILLKARARRNRS